MIYLVTAQAELFDNNLYSLIDIDTSLRLLEDFKFVQFDTEGTGLDCHIAKILIAQFGNVDKSIQIIVDVETIDLRIYKNILESKYIIGQNLKYDLKMLFNYGIVPMKVYDTMIVEQVLHLGWSSDPSKPNFLSVSLASIANRRLNIVIDKTIRGQINTRGLDSEVLQYAAKDVMYLADIMNSQLKECKSKDCLKAAKLECDFVPVIAYMEWCGIKLDEDKWKAKMAKDLKGLEEAKRELDAFVINNPKLQQFTYINTQGDLFEGFDLTPKCSIQWTSSAQVIKVAKALGFDTKVQDIKTGEDKDSVIKKHLKKQKGISDEFLRLYFGKGEEGDEDYFPGHQGMAKLVSSFGQGHLNAINPITGRIHTEYKQLGADTGRMSSGSKANNNDLAKLKKLPINPSTKQKSEGLGCPYPNMQQLPHDQYTRSCFVAEEGNLWVSCDYSAIESRLGADIYNEKSMIEEFLHGSGDLHSLTCWMIFRKECEALGCKSVADVKKLAPYWRNRAKPIEFSQQFGGSEFAIQNSMGCSMEEAVEFKEAYAKGFPGIAKFKEKSSKEVRSKGYIVLCPITGHKTYWWDHNIWEEKEKSHTSEFWDKYKLIKSTWENTRLIDPNTPKPQEITEVSYHFKAASKWYRKALNSVTQGCGAIILKHSQIEVFKWVLDNGYFGKILLNNLTHDEANWEFPENLKDIFPKLLQDTMEQTAAIYCKSLPIPAEATVGKHWIH